MFVGTILMALLAHYPWLRMPFNCLIFPCFTINSGPFAISFNHHDYNNAPGIPCVITALDNFNLTQGRHVILFAYGMIMEFPPGATVMLLSGCVHHGNTAIQEGKYRTSIISYMAGSLARDLAYGFCLQDKVPLDELKAINQDRPSQVCEIVECFSTLSLIVADQLLICPFEST
jgi:hypothetical protein